MFVPRLVSLASRHLGQARVAVTAGPGWRRSGAEQAASFCREAKDQNENSLPRSAAPQKPLLKFV